MTLTKDLFDTLAGWDTPTICNALEMVAPERRGHGFTIKPFTVLRPKMAPIVGLARTARIRAAAPDPRGPQPRDPYYEYIAKADLPTVVVIEDLDPENIAGATSKDGGLAALVSSRRAKLWDTYVERFKAKSAHHDRGMIDAFMILFAEMYDRQG